MVVVSIAEPNISRVVLKGNRFTACICTRHDFDIREQRSDETLFVYLKCFILLSADDTTILADSTENLQCALNIYAAYCEK